MKDLLIGANRIAIVTSALLLLVLPATDVLAEQATDLKCDGCVAGTDLARLAVSSDKIRNGAVSGSKIAQFAVSSDKIRKGAVIGDKLAPLAVSTDKIRDGSVTGPKIATGAVGVTQIDPSQVQMRVGGSCAVGSYISGIAENGTVTCQSGGTATVMTANGNDLTGGVPVVDNQDFWLDECLTPAYVAGRNEVALITASVGLTFNIPTLGYAIVVSFENGTPVTYSNGFYFVEQSDPALTVVDRVALVEGVEYRFGGMALVQGGGVTRSRLSCQSMAQIVRIPQ